MPTLPRSYSLHAIWKGIVARALREMQVHEGSTWTGVVIGAGLEAAREHIARHQGPEAAFNTLTRQADAALAPMLHAQTTKGDR